MTDNGVDVHANARACGNGPVSVRVAINYLGMLPCLNSVVLISVGIAGQNRRIVSRHYARARGASAVASSIASRDLAVFADENSVALVVLNRATGNGAVRAAYHSGVVDRSPVRIDGAVDHG